MAKRGCVPALLLQDSRLHPEHVTLTACEVGPFPASRYCPVSTRLQLPPPAELTAPPLFCGATLKQYASRAPVRRSFCQRRAPPQLSAGCCWSGSALNAAAGGGPARSRTATAGSAAFESSKKWINAAARFSPRRHQAAWLV